MSKIPYFMCMHNILAWTLLLWPFFQFNMGKIILIAFRALCGVSNELFESARIELAKCLLLSPKKNCNIKFIIELISR